jgi:hypothetical protein
VLSSSAIHRPAPGRMPRANTYVSGCGPHPGAPPLVFDRSHRLIAEWPGSTYRLLRSPVFGPGGEVFALASDGSILKLRVTLPGACHEGMKADFRSPWPTRRLAESSGRPRSALGSAPVQRGKSSCRHGAKTVASTVPLARIRI